MKKPIIFFVLFMIFCKTLFAIPAIPHPVTFTQPNGDTLTVMIKGDERIHWHESMDGYTLLYNQDKYLTYAQLDEDGNLQPSHLIAKNIEQRDIVSRSFLYTIEKKLFYSDVQQQVMKKVWEIEDKAAAQGESKADRAVSGSYKTICAFVQFSEKAFIKPMSQFEPLFNQLGYTTNGTGSVRDFFRESSYGQLDLVITLCGPYTAPKAESYYAGSDGSTNCQELARWVAQQVAAESSINFAEYDSDNNGSVDGFHFIFAGRGQESGAGTGTIWSHKWQFSPAVTQGGKSISIYSCSPELLSGTTITTIGVIAHEMTHAFGAADFYDTNGSTGGDFLGTGRWDLMADGSWNGSPSRDGNRPAHHSMYVKVQFGWVTPVVLNSATTITNMPNSAENPVAYRINTATNNEYFLLENRQQVKFDTNIPGNGLIIYHVHSTISSSGINDGHPQKMYPVCASATAQVPTLTPSSYGSINTAGCPFPGSSNKTTFNDTSIPAMKSWAPANVGKPITNITNTNKLVSFDFMGGAPATYTVTLPTVTGATIAPSGGSSSPVNHGGNYSFTVTLNANYNQSTITVKANGTVLTPVSGVYTMSNITANQTVTVEGVQINTYTVTLPTVTGATIAASGGSSSPVNHGGSYSFTVTLNANYNQSTITVKANGTVLTPVSGVYTISNIATNQTVTVEGVQINTYTVTLPTVTGATIAPSGGSSSPVNHGGNYSFTVTLNANYNQSTITVKANDTVLTPVSGVYTMSNITANQTVTVEGVQINTYTVTLPTVTGATIAPSGGSSSPVNHGGNYSFTVTLNANYNQSTITVKANGTVLTPVSGVYTMSNITANQTVTVEGVQINTYTVTLPTVTGATIAPSGGSSSPVNHGGNYSFTVTLNANYNQSTITVKANGTVLTPVSGVYTMSNITTNQTVTVEGVQINTYTVTLPTVTGATIAPSGGSSSPVNHGGNYSFTVTLNANYNQSTITVKANGTVLTPVSGVYTMSNITANQNITVEGVQINTYTVTLPTVTGATIAPSGGSSSPVNHGGSYSFTVTLNANYNQSTITVKANGTVLTPVSGVYTMSNITTNQTVTVEGVQINTYTVTLPTVTGATIAPSGGSSSPVNHGGSYSFTVTLNANYNQSTITVKANGTVLTPVSGVYTMSNITANQVVTVEGVQINTYTVTLPTVTGATIAPSGGSSSPVNHGGSYSFTVTLNANYNQSTITVKANGTVLTPVSGVYTMSNITTNQTVTVEGVQINTYTVTLPTVTGATIAASGGSSSPVNHGGSYSFTVTLNANYNQSTITVKANGTVLNPTAGVYTMSNLTANQTVTVEGVQINTYTVTLPNVTGATIAPAGGSSSPVNHGGNYSFTVTLNANYNQSTIIVKANGTVLTPTASVYVISNITENQTVTVEGVQINTYTVTFMSNGGEGSMDPQEFTCGEPQTLTPNSFTKTGYKFIGWNTQEEGDGESYEDQQNMTIEEDLTLFAQWELLPPNQFIIMATATEGGEISPNGQIVVLEGESQRFTIMPNSTPEEEYYILDVLVDGISVGVVEEYLFENVNDNHTIHAVFEYNGIHDPAGFNNFLYVVPNPANDYVELRIRNYELGPELNSGIDIKFYNVFGQLVKSMPCHGEINDNTLIQRISIADLSKGVYFIKAGNETAKLIKQ